MIGTSFHLINVSEARIFCGRNENDTELETEKATQSKRGFKNQ